MTRCKFYCSEKTERWGTVYDPTARHAKVYDYKFYVVSGDSPENKSFFASTPTGELKVTTVWNNSFEPGKEYYLDIMTIEEGEALAAAAVTASGAANTTIAPAASPSGAGGSGS